MTYLTDILHESWLQGFIDSLWFGEKGYGIPDQKSSVSGLSTPIMIQGLETWGVL